MITTTLIFDERVYSVDAVQKAAYRFINVFSCNFRIVDGKIECDIESSEQLSEEAFQSKIHDFKKEVLDQHLRQKIKDETEGVRNLILSVAFSKTGLQQGE